VAFGNNLFVAVGDQSTIMTSPDGLYWTKRTVPTPPGPGQSFRGIEYGDGSFVLTGYSGIILTSTDGVTWTQKTSGTSTNLRGIGFGISSGNGTFVTGGDNGVILQSGTFTVPGAPTGVTAVAGNAQATASFTAPASDGGSPITLYTVTSTPGGITATGTSSPITVTGLTNGTTYTFTVKATNAIGTGPESAPSNSVTPYSGGGGGYSTGANENMIALIAILAISAGVLILRKRRKIQI
jgi:LPXTG-motif cell wall-anchored protein